MIFLAIAIVNSIFLAHAALAAPPITQTMTRGPVQAHVHLLGGAQSQPVPIRRAKVIALVTKSWKEKQTDGSFKQMQDSVCTLTGTVPVYQISTGDLNFTPSETLSCKTQLKIGSATIHLFALAALRDDMENPFAAGTLVDWKAFLAGFYVISEGGDFFKVGSMGLNAVENQDVRTMILNLFSSQLTSNRDSDSKLDENVQILVRIED
ncbi:MAG: hypothetical protein AB7G93_17315 [Bdellovibrionales bacterium]